MSYSIALADRVREYLADFPELKIEEKRMFGGLAFLVNGKMCVNISEDNLMCRFDPALRADLEAKTGFMPLIMKGKIYKGYCLVEPIGMDRKDTFEFWINLCLDYNKQAVRAKKR